MDYRAQTVKICIIKIPFHTTSCEQAYTNVQLDNMPLVRYTSANICQYHSKGKSHRMLQSRQEKLAASELTQCSCPDNADADRCKKVRVKKIRVEKKIIRKLKKAEKS